MALSRNVRLGITYASDWIVTALALLIAYLLDRIDGHWRYFSLNDETIQFPMALQERIPPWLLLVISVAVPFVLMAITNLVAVRSLWDFHCSALGLLLSYGLTSAITQLAKVTVGRPRPDFIDRCRPLAGSQNAAVFGLSNATICTQTDHAILVDGFRSFFSGHSSLSFAGLGFLSFYLAGKVHLFDHRGHQGKAWLALIPLMGAAFVAISRTMDNRHHWHDVLTGSFIGLVVSYFAYRQYYRPLTSELSHKPYSPRIPRDQQKLAADLEEHGVPLTESNMEMGRLTEGRDREGRSLETGPVAYGNAR